MLGRSVERNLGSSEGILVHERLHVSLCNGMLMRLDIESIGKNTSDALLSTHTFARKQGPVYLRGTTCKFS
jgi:hypothetical protein